MNTKQPKLTNRQRKAQGLNVPSPDRVRSDQARRASSAGLPHDSRPNRQRSRAAAKRAAVREW